MKNECLKELEELQRELYLIALKIKNIEKSHNFFIQSTMIDFDPTDNTMTIMSVIPFIVLKNQHKKKSLKELTKLIQEWGFYDEEEE